MMIVPPNEEPLDASLPPLVESCNPPISDPPPPYPSPRRSRAARSNRRHAHRIQITSHHAQQPSTDSHSDYETLASPQALLSPNPFPSSEDAGVEASESTPFLSPASPTRRLMGRPRTVSHTSTLFSSTSGAPSLTQTMFSLFRTDGELELDDDSVDEEQGRILLMPEERGRLNHFAEQQRRYGFFSKHAWRRYFRPLKQKVYYRSLFHLLVLNFPYALAAWVYLFVFTLTGTTLLMALPLGAVLCFFNLLGARAFARGELALQTRFHTPLAYPAPYPPRPIFTRFREPTTSEIEGGTAAPGILRAETSFYKNTYAMFTDPTSYQAIFYFLVIKPSITLLFSIALIILIPPAFIFVIPAPMVLRAVRKFGIWQANVAVEGLYMAVR